MRKPPILVPLAATLILWGCGTPNSQQMRIDARDRVGAMRGDLEHDQAVQAYETGQFERALGLVDSAIRFAPRDPDHHVLRGRICLEMHRLEPALESFEAALTLDPGLADAHYRSGIVYQRWSDDVRAHDCYARAFEADPANVAYLLAAAESLIALERYDEAEALVQEKLAYFEHNPALRQILARIALLQEKSGPAADILEEAWRLDPEDDILLEELVHTLYDAGRYAEALRRVGDLQKHLRERRPDLMICEARCLAQLGRNDDAVSRLLEVTRVAPEEPQTWAELGALAWEEGDWERLAFAAARLVALSPQRFEGHLFKAICAHRHGDRHEAITFLRQAAVRSGSDPLPHLVLGRLLEEEADVAGALAAYADALRLDPRDEDALALHGALSGVVAAPEVEGLRE